MKIVLAIDSFKNCLTSEEAEKAAADAFLPSDEVTSVLVSDGGEGFTQALTKPLNGRMRSVEVLDPIGRSLTAWYGICQDTAIIETAAASGIQLLSTDQRNPLSASSFGTGLMIKDAVSQGCRDIYLGLGGTATNDGGTGLLQALGCRFFCKKRIIAPGRATMEEITCIDPSGAIDSLSETSITCFYDVNVPFYGPDGASLMFSPQKGASAADAEALDLWMKGLGGLYSSCAGIDANSLKGSGAAGGIGGALGCLLQASMKRGIEGVLELNGFASAIEKAAYVITGEGRADRQTIKGKAPAGILEFTNRISPGTKVLLIAGSVSDRAELLNAGFDAVIQVTPDNTPLEKALDKEFAKHNIIKSIKKYGIS
ncbi:MAG: glycerate kinase [Bacteroidales bacterium]